MLIDSHIHSYTKEDIEKLLLGMKANGIDKSVIMYWPWPTFGGRKVPPFERVLENIKSHKNLFLAGSMVVTDSKNYETNIKMLEAALSKKQIVGIKLCLGYDHIFANDERCDAIYELCLKYKVPAVFHTGDTWNMISNSLVRYANPIYIDDVAVKYPKLKIIISHIGNPCWIKETAEVIYKNKNAYADFSGILASSGWFEIYNDGIKQQIIEMAAYCENPRKLLFGTDYYVHRHEPYIKFVKSLEDVFPKTDLEYIRHKNAERLFGI